MGFEYVAPRSLAEAVAILDSAGPEACPIAGGTDLVLEIRLGRRRPRLLVGVGRLPELAGIDAADGRLRVGAAATLAEIARSPLVRAAAPLLAAVCAEARSPQVRTLATLGGALAGASPLAEPPLALLTLGAELVLRGPGGERTLGVEELIRGPGETALRPGEVLVEARLAPLPAGAGWGYERLSRRAAVEPPLLAAAAVVGRDGAGLCSLARVVLGLATPRPLRLADAEAALLGQEPALPAVEAAARSASAAEFREGTRASGAYRRRVAPALVARAIARAAALAGALADAGESAGDGAGDGDGDEGGRVA